jgi:hypothetical protein
MKKNIVVIGLGIAALVIGAQSAAALAVSLPHLGVASASPTPSFAWQQPGESGQHGKRGQHGQAGQHGKHLGISGDVRGHVNIGSGDVRTPRFGTGDVRDIDLDSMDVRPNHPTGNVRFEPTGDVRFRPAPNAVSGDTRQAPGFGRGHGGHH